ncbi:MAG: glycosyl hydrolase [Acutalibacteraceae bacterium]
MVGQLKKKAALFLALIVSLCSLFIYGGNYSVSAQEPVDGKANSQVRNILNYLNELRYSDKCVMGAFDQVNQNQDALKNYYAIVSEKFGIKPGMYSTFYPYTYKTSGVLVNEFAIQESDETFKRIKEHYEEGAIILVHFQNSWGTNLIKEFSDAANNSYGETVEKVDFLKNFDATNPDKNQHVYERYLSCLKQMGDALELLQNAGITVIYRPFVEMTNPNFECYAQSQSGYDAFKRIWQQHYDYMVNERGLHNIVWCYAPQAAGGAEQAMRYYPGNDYVDVIGVTMYPGGETGTESMMQMLERWSFDGFFKTGKPFGFSELGTMERDNESGNWSKVLDGVKNTLSEVTFCNIWNNTYGLLVDTNVNADKFVYDSFFVHLDDQPDLKTGTYSAAGVAAAFSKSKYNGDIQVLPLGNYTRQDMKKANINPSKFVSFRLDEGYAIQFYTQDNFKGKSYLLASDTQDISSIGLNASEIKSMKVGSVKIENASLKKPVLCSDPDSNYEYINDGTVEFWETYEGKPCWAVIDLQDIYLLTEWEVQNVGAYGEDSISNASDYRLQYSLDCKNWKDADVVFGNTVSVTSQKLEQVKAQYVRLYVEKPNRSEFAMDLTRCAICEFTVYGVKLSGGKTTDWTLMDLSSKSQSGSSDKSNVQAIQAILIHQLQAPIRTASLIPMIMYSRKASLSRRTAIKNRRRNRVTGLWYGLL